MQKQEKRSRFYYIPCIKCMNLSLLCFSIKQNDFSQHLRDYVNAESASALLFGCI